METSIHDEELQKYLKPLLRYLWEKNNVTADDLKRQQNIVLNLAVGIHAALEFGMGFGQIADLLRCEGLEIGGDTLRELYYQHYLEKAKSDLMEKVRLLLEADDKRCVGLEHLLKFEDRLNQLDQKIKVIFSKLKRLEVAPPQPVAASNGTAKTPEGGNAGCSASAVPEGEAKAVRASSAPSPSPAQVAAVSVRQLEDLLSRHLDAKDIPRRPENEVPD